ncbi:MAG TPA: molecular chaperone DnaK, partial [Acidobacteria bacterium]|nr:molecular chaperone DnaK [Acidobacteriota bacterium]
EAKVHQSEDEIKRQEIEARNKLDALVYSTEKLINDNKDKLPEAETQKVNEVLADAKRALEEGGKERLEAAHERLTQASHTLAAVLYQATGGQPGAGAGPQGATDTGAAAGAPGGQEDEVIDAEYVDVDAENAN